MSPRLTPLDGITFAFGEEVAAASLCESFSIETQDQRPAELVTEAMHRVYGARSRTGGARDLRASLVRGLHE
jgi:hypothetical protein